jgi:phosphatidyl-myo-inositol dimannoside synthase
MAYTAKNKEVKNYTTLIGFDFFCKTGGIQKVGRTLCFTLENLYSESTGHDFAVCSLNDAYSDHRYVSATKFFSCSGNRLKFFYYIITNYLRSNTIIICHLHLAWIFLLIYPLNPSCKIVVLAHGVEFWKRLNPLLLRYLKNHATIWAVSRFTKSSLTSRHSWDPEKIKVVNNCLDPHFDIPKGFTKPKELVERYQITNSAPVMLTICRLNQHERRKGYTLVIELMPELLKIRPDLHYIIGGEIDTRERTLLHQLLTEMGLEHNVTISGFISDAELTQHYLLADVFIMPSSKEGFGLVFTEAVVCGCNAIGGGKDGSADALMDGKLGDLLDPSAQSSMIELILGRLNNPDTQRKYQLQELCIRHFGFEVYNEKIKTLLK